MFFKIGVLDLSIQRLRARQAHGWKIFFKLWVNQSIPKPFNCQPHKMVKHTQTICRLLPMNCLCVFDHFVGLTLKGLDFPHLSTIFRSQSTIQSIMHISQPIRQHILLRISDKCRKCDISVSQQKKYYQTQQQRHQNNIQYFF